jgi:hypothetical protein
MNDFVIEINKYARDKILEFQLSCSRNEGVYRSDYKNGPT